MEKWEKRPWIDVTCSYIPVEIIHAAGFTPRRVVFPVEVKNKAFSPASLPVNFCSYVKACLHPNDAAGIVFTTCCDSMRRGYDLITTCKKPAFLLDLPRSLTSRTTDYYQEQLLHLANWLVEIGGKPVTRESLANSMTLYNNLKYQLNNHLQESNNIWEFVLEKQKLIQAFLTTSPEEVLKQLKVNFWAAGLKEKGASSLKKIPILLSGTTLPEVSILTNLMESNFNLVALDFCGEARFTPLADNFSFSANFFELLKDLTLTYLNRPPCPRMVFQERRAAYLANLLLSSKAKGVIYYSLKFCDHGLYEVPLWRRICQQQKTAFLHLETEYQSSISGQLGTRLQAFKEAIQGRFLT
jgi:benzoyl-CoA reductase/2-hydroxyglutaryl-CoA dehydratase subunit BcrC/BadD/HgdB